jgi:hypothetical protein
VPIETSVTTLQSIEQSDAYLPPSQNIAMLIFASEARSVSTALNAPPAIVDTYKGSPLNTGQSYVNDSQDLRLSQEFQIVHPRGRIVHGLQKLVLRLS